MKPWDAMAQRVKPFDGREIIEARTVESKLFDLGGGKKKLVRCISPIHYDTGNGLDEIDLTPRLVGDEWIIDKAPYVLRIARNGAALDYEGRLTGKHVRMSHRIPRGRDRQSIIEGLKARWIIEDEKEAELVIRPASIIAASVIKGPGGGKLIEWEADVELPPLRGTDAKHNPVEMSGKRFTGRVSRMVDPKVRRRAFSTEIDWPVRVV